MSYFSVIFVIAAIILLMQLILAVLMQLELKKYGDKYNFYHSSQMTMVDLLERFSRDYGKINLKVNRRVPDVAMWIGDTLAVDNKAVYRKDALAGILVVRELLGGLLGHFENVNWLLAVQRFVFLIELVAIVVALTWQTTIGGIVAVCAGLFCIVLNVLVERQQANFLDVVLRRTSELLDWDNVEQAKGEKLIHQFEGEGYWYVSFPIVWLVRFFRAN